ncbi:IS3 family transposase [Streptomyces sp. NPDC058545]|uniref:IS3 family transposase n=1 Tax=Streptomyces sp. NPDC058545 TaxID=3346544 RepID=UPI003664F382
MTVHPFIEAEKQSGHNVMRACELLKVSRTAFYARRTGKPGPRAVREAELTGQIAAVHQHSRGTYGAPRIHAALQRKGAGCGRRRVARLMRAAGLQGRHRRRWHLTTIPDPRAAYVAAIAVLSIAVAFVWQKADLDQRKEKAAAYKGRSGASLNIDAVSADVVAHWTRDGDSVIVELRSYFDPDARYLRIDASGKSASSVREDGWFPEEPEVVLPVKDPLADVTVRVAIGGKSWKEGMRAPSRTIRLSPADAAFDAETGKQLPSD